MSNNGSDDHGEFDQSTVFYPENVVPDFGRQFDAKVIFVVKGGFLVETSKYAFFLPEDEAKAAGLALKADDSVVVFSTLFDERFGMWLAACHPLVLDEHDLTLVQRARESEEWIEVKVSGQNDRGLRLVCGTIGGFMFFGDVDWGKHHRNGSQPKLIGQTIPVRITSCTDFRGLPCFYASERDEGLVFDWSTSSVDTDSFPVAVGEIFDGTVTGFLANNGVFVDLGNGICGLMPIGEIDYRFIIDIRNEFEQGQRVQVKVLKVEWAEGRDGQRKLHVVLSAKALKLTPILVSNFEEEFDYWDQ